MLSEHTPSRTIQINDLLNPIPPQSRPLAAHSRFHSQSSASPALHRPHTFTLPGINTLAGSPSPYYSRALDSPSSQRTDSPRSAGPRTPIELLNEPRISPTRLTSGQQHTDPFNFRNSNWTPGIALPPLQTIYDPLERKGHSDVRSGFSTPHSADTKSPFHFPPRTPLATHSTSPTGTYAISPTHLAYSGTHHHLSSPTGVVALPHSPYGTQSAPFGPSPYAHPPHLVGRPSMVPQAGSSPSMMASSAQSRDEVKNSYDVTMASPDPSTSGERSSTRLAIRASLTPVNDERQLLLQSPYVLQLHPTQQPQHNHKKRSHADANGGPQTYHAERRSSTSSLSSLSPLSSDEPELLAGGSGEFVDGSVPKSRKKKESDSPTTATSSVDTLNSAAKKGKKTSKKQNGLEGNAIAATSATSSSRKGKEKSNAPQASAPYYPGPCIQPLDPYMTMQLGYGVGVVPIREGVPLVPYAYPIPVPMSVTPGMGLPMAVPGQSQGQAPMQTKLFPEMQYARCMSARYKADPFPRCVSCTRRWAGDTCRFQNIRILLRDANKVLMAVGFQSLTAKDEAPELVYPQSWNINLEPRHVERTMATVAKSLLPHLMKEQNHQKHGSIVKRQRETDVRATCDTCMTSLFSNSWMCRQCGREACEECFETIRRLTAEPSTVPSPNGTAKSASAQRALKERHAQSNPFFLSCNRKAEHGVHTFVPVTRFSKKELDEAVLEMEKLVVREEDVSQTKKEDDTSGDNMMDVDSSQHGENRTNTTPGRSTSSRESTESLTPDTYNDGICTLVENPVPPHDLTSLTSTPHLPPSSSTDLEVPSWPVPYYTDENLTEPVFAAQWARGTPLVVTGLMKRLNLEWSPSYFINTYGQQPCIVLECQTDANKKVTVGEFFSSFGNYENRTECWKLKDWPPSADFKWTFPELYEDFNRAVPIPNYTRRDGVLNIASHFPSNTIAPDLGPKMYNAYAAADVEGSKGTTRLHMDMADAVNIMCHAERTATGEPGCAAWDIYRAEDSAKLRSFFKRHYRGQYQNDPIHSQTFYLDPVKRKQLYEEYGVRSFRIYQRPGEAVFIPAGCAHQVCNLSDCIKVACDFVSPENVERCERLTREFRAQNQVLVWKEDVLQLRSMMWFSWLSCRKKLREMRENGGDGHTSNAGANLGVELTGVAGPSGARR